MFGRRTEVRDARDRYTNRYINYLAQRREHLGDPANLTTHPAGNIDPAFPPGVESASARWPNRWTRTGGTAIYNVLHAGEIRGINQFLLVF